MARRVRPSAGSAKLARPGSVLNGRGSRQARTKRAGAPARRRDSVAKVTMPQLGESVAEGTIGRWLKKPGDRVEKYEPIVEVITDKVNAEVPSPFAGVLTAILAEEGAIVPNNADIAEIETSDAEAAPAQAPAPAAAAPAEAATPAQAATTPVPSAQAARVAPALPAPIAPPAPNAAAAAPVVAAPAPAMLPDSGDPDTRMTPAVRRLLREHGLSAAQVPGTGGGGRITRDDVLAVVEAIRTGGTGTAPSAAAAPAPSAGAAPAAPAAPAAIGAPAPAAAGPVVVFPPGADEV